MKNVFVVGLDDFNLSQMESMPAAKDCRFHALFRVEEVKRGDYLPVRRMLTEGMERLRHFPGSVDAIVGYWDFPVSTLLPLLRQPFGLPSPSFRSVLRCEHKYWCRLEQQQVVPETSPDFCAVNPFAGDPLADVTLDFPFWLKPVKSVSSHLGFMVRNRADFDHAIAEIRTGILRFAKPFNYLLEQAELPPEVAAVDGTHCIAEGVISRGRQCTLEGYVHEGQVHCYGLVDSIRNGRCRSCFSRYQYPSRMPDRVRAEMESVARRFMNHIGFDKGPFNIEFYWDGGADRIWLLEVNTRISKSHCPLFREVDGISHHQVMLDLALGRRPDFPQRRGRYRHAAKFMWRVYEDAEVTSVPDRDQIRRIEQRYPGTEILLQVHPGMRLSDMKEQDSYSYEIAVIYLGGNSQEALRRRYRQITEELAIGLAPVAAGQERDPPMARAANGD